MSNITIPATQRAILLHETGGPEVLKVEIVPTPRVEDLPEGGIIIKNHKIGLNMIDTYHRQGLPGYPQPKGAIIGRESAGVVAASNNPAFKVGDRVVQYSTGAYAEYIQVNNPKWVWKLSDGISDTLAAGTLLQGLTALGQLRNTHETKPGQTVLVTAAAGGTGQALVQIAKLLGATVIGTVSNEEKAAIARSVGADHVIITPRGPPTGNPADHVIPKTVREITNGRGVDAVFDGVGKDTFDVALASLAIRGSFVSFGNASGIVPPLAIGRLAAGNWRLSRPTLNNNIATREEFEELAKELYGWIESGKLKVSIYKEYSFDEIPQAHTDLQGGITTGKLIIDLTH
ncbi:NAD(P)-binding protein [Ramicandelaber brevisporus]|nr:NAD(P)-binding protein [Ramicandelaber brevisporus]